jgi:tetratricopeptide (TPR) repeat protein
MKYSELLILVCACILPTYVRAHADSGKYFPGPGPEGDWQQACALSAGAEKLLPQEAIVKYKLSVAKYPYESIFYYDLAQMELRLGDYKGAEHASKDGLQYLEKYPPPRRSPDDHGPEHLAAKMYVQLGTLLDRENRTDEAEKAFAKAITLDGASSGFYARFLKRHGKTSQAAALVKKYGEWSAPADSPSQPFDSVPVSIPAHPHR